jgi:hypothetical protein
MNARAGFSFFRLWPTHAFRISVIAGMIMLMACSSKPTEVALKQTIAELKAAGEARDMSAFMEHVADDFSGQQGEYNKTALSRYLLAIRVRTSNIGITTTYEKLDITGNAARVQMSVLLTDSGGVLPENGQYLRADTTWRYVSGEWLLVSADWRQGLLEN